MISEGKWQPRVGRDVLRARAHMLCRIRDFMAQRDILEVETPLLGDCRLIDSAIESMAVLPSEGSDARHGVRYLQTSPEYGMKRLLAAWPMAIYQICKVFRAGEQGTLHQPEFTMLEWYRPEYDQLALLDECAALLQHLGLGPVERCSYQSLFVSRLGLQPHTATLAELREQANALGFVSDSPHRAVYLEVIAHHLVQAAAQDQALFVYDYPACMAALACLGERSHGAVAERFELFIDGMEIANGCEELRDADEAERRFHEERERRRLAGQPSADIDSLLLAALRAGLPKCAGVAWGLDRLLMALLGERCIDQVLCFPVE